MTQLRFWRTPRRTTKPDPGDFRARLDAIEARLAQHQEICENLSDEIRDLDRSLAGAIRRDRAAAD